MAAELGETGPLQIRAVLNLLLIDVVDFFNVGKTMSNSQIIQTADLIVQDYSHFKPEDFKLCFQNAMKGHYGKLYDRIDGQIILDWLIAFDNARDAEIETIRAKENRELKQAPALGLVSQLAAVAGNQDDETFKTNIEKLKKQLEQSKKAREAEARIKATQVFDKGPVHAMHQRWMQQFEDMHYVRAVPSKGIRFVKKYGRYLDKSAYLEHKQWQYTQLPGLRKELHKQINEQ